MTLLIVSVLAGVRVEPDLSLVVGLSLAGRDFVLAAFAATTGWTRRRVSTTSIVAKIVLVAQRKSTTTTVIIFWSL